MVTMIITNIMVTMIITNIMVNMIITSSLSLSPAASSTPPSQVDHREGQLCDLVVGDGEASL